jgi:hypothetical protein
MLVAFHAVSDSPARRRGSDPFGRLERTVFDSIHRPKGCFLTITNCTGATSGTAFFGSTMIHQFQYPKVTPIRPGSGSGSKPSSSPGAARPAHR